MERRNALASRIDAIFTRGASVLRMCGDGKPHNWSILVADLFFVNCPCCLFWRGVFMGALITSAIAIAIGLLI